MSIAVDAGKCTHFKTNKFSYIASETYLIIQSVPLVWDSCVAR